MTTKTIEDLIDLITDAIDGMSQEEFSIFERDSSRIMADSSRRMTDCDQLSPEFHVADCHCLRCLSLRA